jgi:mRNA interferase HigB
MHIVTRSRLREFYADHPTVKTSLLTWYKIASHSTWQDFNELRQTHPTADLVGNFTIFNIGGNKCRLITFIDYDAGKIFIRHVLTHAEYDKGKWKNDRWFT